MLYSLSYQMYKQEHGLETAAGQQAADARAGEAPAAFTAALGGLRLVIGRVLRPRDRGRPADEAADAVTAPARIMSSAR
jgi:hypothetical protein